MINFRRFGCKIRLNSRSFASSPSSSNTAGKQTHFGFETVDENEKSRKVYDVFENVASRYDLMNDVMSFGVHRFWKDHFVRRLNPTSNIRLLDVAGGTGDIAFRVLRHIDYKRSRPERIGSSIDWSVPGVTASPSATVEPTLGRCPVTVCDINQAMLDVGQRKALELGLNERAKWVLGDAEKLPFDDNEFDAYTIAFGIRNCTHIDKVLQEAFRVLKRGGRFMCLEFSQVWVPGLRSLYD